MNGENLPGHIFLSVLLILFFAMLGGMVPGVGSKWGYRITTISAVALVVLGGLALLIGIWVGP